MSFNFLKDLAKLSFFTAFILLSTMNVKAASELDIEKGKTIYMKGRLPSGKEVEALRGEISIKGEQAACVSCHRPSGMGSVEGNIIIPPITGHYLFRTGNLPFATMDPISGKRFNQQHEPYTPNALNQAIKKGLNVGGREMNTLMPRYQMTDEEVGYITAYLGQLSQDYSPGIKNGTIQFATIITPEVDPSKKTLLIKTLTNIFAQKNRSTINAKNIGHRHMVTAAELVLGTEKKWELNVWELSGDSSTWSDQLKKYYDEKPIFAVMSGLSGASWQPVHDFCNKQKIPCWFPSVDFAPPIDNSFYSVYFQRGIGLESQVLAKFLSSKNVPKKIIQFHQNNDLGNKAAFSLQEAFNKTGPSIEDQSALLIDKNKLISELANLSAKDAVILWLRPEDLAIFSDIPAPKATVFISGRLIGDHQFPLPADWAKQVKMVYPYELPDQRQASLDYFHHWLFYNQIPIEDEPLQAEIFFAASSMTETMIEMLDNLYRDYLIERAESMLSRNERAKYEQRERISQSLRWSSRNPRGTEEEQAMMKDDIKHNEQILNNRKDDQGKGKGTSIYPRLSLGISQRFASKGAYIVSIDPNTASSNKPTLLPDSEWIIP